MEKKNGVISAFDHCGTIQFPADIRQEFNIKEGEPYEFSYDPVTRSITLTPFIYKRNETQRILFQVNGSMSNSLYLFIQSCDDGWDYGIYDNPCFDPLDGGQLDMPDLTICDAAVEICKMHDINEKSLVPLPVSRHEEFI